MNSSPTPHTLKDEGMRLFQQGKRREALPLFEQASAGFAAQEDVCNQAEMLNNMGVVLRVLGDWETALEKGRLAQKRARAFTWERTAAETFAFLEEISANFR